jgi:hypothetical protein
METWFSERRVGLAPVKGEGPLAGGSERASLRAGLKNTRYMPDSTVQAKFQDHDRLRMTVRVRQRKT